MKKEVILLGLSSEKQERIVSHFSEAFHFYSTSQFFDLKDMLRKHDVDAVLIDSQGLSDANKLMTKHYPYLPTVILDDRRPKSMSKNLVRHIDTNSDFTDIEKMLNKVISVGQKNQKRLVNSEHIKVQNKLNLLPGTELQDLMDSTMTVLGKYLKTDNIFWVEKDKIDFYVHEMWKIQALKNHYKNRGKGKENKTIFSTMGATPKDITSTLQKITNALGPSWSKQDKVQYIEGMVLVPSCKMDNCYGYFICLDVQKFNLYKVARVLESLKDYLGFRYELASEYNRVKELSYIDDLTDLYNQRYLSIAIDDCIKNYEERQEKFCVLFMDIDHFKKVNDQRGHLVGSKILVELGKILKQNIRSRDYGFRYGGDEYLLLLANTDEQTAHVVAERIRSQVENTVFHLNEQDLQITLSIGIACFPTHAKTKDAILEIADEAMYYGKNKCRNIVYVAS
tara:strand:- start:13372 stop:14727 length:1356 start_codon:yes stop_codon:yes gene_type:complete